jgi:2-haloacid dehalogenase
MDAVLFDLGRVLLDWDPRYYYGRFFGNDEALEHFVRQVVPHEWYLEMDAGKPMELAVAERQCAHPEYAGLIAGWKEGWPLMMRGAIDGSVAILDELRREGLRLYALTNFSTETWPVAKARFGFLSWFEDAIVSGEHGIVKPDPRIFELAISRCRLDPARTAFVDDVPANVDAGRACGLRAIQFTSPEKLREDLAALGLLGPRDPGRIT